MSSKTNVPSNPASSSEDAAILKRHNELHAFLHECTTCQQDIEPNWQFCAHCGTRLAITCPGCGAPLPPAGAHSCPACGLEIPKIDNIQLEG